MMSLIPKLNSFFSFSQKAFYFFFSPPHRPPSPPPKKKSLINHFIFIWGNDKTLRWRLCESPTVFYGCYARREFSSPPGDRITARALTCTHYHDVRGKQGHEMPLLSINNCAYRADCLRRNLEKSLNTKRNKNWGGGGEIRLKRDLANHVADDSNVSGAIHGFVLASKSTSQRHS